MGVRLNTRLTPRHEPSPSLRLYNIRQGRGGFLYHLAIKTGKWPAAEPKIIGPGTKLASCRNGCRSNGLPHLPHSSLRPTGQCPEDFRGNRPKSARTSPRHRRPPVLSACNRYPPSDKPFSFYSPSGFIFV